MALKQIRKDQARAGMWISEIKGFWLFHPFWEAGFLLRHPDDIEAIHNAWIKGVVIDTARGIDVGQAGPAAGGGNAVHAYQDRLQAYASTSQPRRRRTLRGPRRRLPPPASCTMAAELGRAGMIVRRARKLMVNLFTQAKLGKVLPASDFDPLIDDISASLSRNRSAIGSILRLKSKDEYTYMHSVAVAALMVNLARELELDEALVKEAGMAGLLHDIGKMGIDDAILNKPGALTDEEFAIVRSHTLRGHALLESEGGAPEGALDVSLHHHEKVDGTGYPKGLKGEEISLFARMGAVCDVYDALTSSRSYKEAWYPAKAIARMQAWEGHFDPDILAAFIRTIGLYPVGSLVRLDDDRLAVVTDIGTSDPARPQVRAFAPRASTDKVELEDLDLALVPRTIVEGQDPAEWGLEEWEVLWPKLTRAPKTKPFALACRIPENRSGEQQAA